jgi:polysaccharide pyruvyl transferase WcaK-like protein
MIYHVFANRSNVGDWLAARAIQSQLAPRPAREVLCDEPFLAQSFPTLLTATERDMIVIGAGGLLMDYFQPFWTRFLPLATRGRVPFCIWGVGFCDLKDRPSRASIALLEPILQRARVCVVRDQLTYRALAGCHLPPPVLCPSTLLLNAASHASRRAVLHVVHLESMGADQYDPLCDVLRQFARSENREYLETNNEIEAGSFHSLNAELELYDNAAVTVSSRLHGCIIALASGCPTIAITGDRKLESFMESLGLNEWTCNPRDHASLRRLLGRYTEQRIPQELFDRARQANRMIGQRIAGMIDEISIGGSTT